MRDIAYRRAATVDDAVRSGSQPEAAFLGGGTSLVDLMKLEVLNPARLVDVTRLDLAGIAIQSDGIALGATATNAAVAAHPEVKRRLPALSEALLSGASPQLRNVATVAGNLMQRTRCAYYRDLATRCNKRAPGAGCDALTGWTRMHAILGGSEHCIATHPSDMCVALAALDATIHLRGPRGVRELPFGDFHLLPGDHPDREFALEPGELVTSVFVPLTQVAARSRYVKVRDRLSYAFALASCAAALEITSGRIQEARIALGGVATKPWRSREAERALAGQAPRKEAFRAAAEVAVQDARPRGDNAFKVELAKRTIVRALTLCAEAS
ncbi:MAG TPA: xanthine dehydrogenase family protein subunit M [Myxococcales bacterium]|jgi:xanthine dehydrogenase YagS FAD-binding subunit|nr:xanthine dehydrogenase family protein subunit M [Myxococcales bacterium]